MNKEVLDFFEFYLKFKYEVKVKIVLEFQGIIKFASNLQSNKDIFKIKELSNYHMC